jgi:hypothetical protein
MTPSYLLNKSMPSMMSIPLESRRMRFDGKSTPLIVMLTAGQICFILISPPGELTSIVCFMVAIGRVRTGKKHTQYYVRGLLSFIAGHMVDPAMHKIMMPLRLHLVSCSKSGRPGGALPHKMASQTTLETSSTSTASLSWCTVRDWGIRAGALLHALARWLLPIRLR